MVPGSTTRWAQVASPKGAIGPQETFFEKAHRRNPEERWYTFPLAATYAHLGREQEAQDLITKSTKGFYRPMALASYLVYLPFKDREIANRIADGLHKAGLK